MKYVFQIMFTSQMMIISAKHQQILQLLLEQLVVQHVVFVFSLQYDQHVKSLQEVRDIPKDTEERIISYQHQVMFC